MEAIVFEYDIQSDVMNFSRNVVKYIPCQVRIMDFSESLELAGKICPDDLKRAIMFFHPILYNINETQEFFRCMDFEGKFCWYSVTGKTILDENNRPALLYGTYTKLSDEDTCKISEKVDILTGLDSASNAEAKIREAYSDCTESAIYNVMYVELTDYCTLLNRNGKEQVDRAVLEIARIFRRSLRSYDVIGRADENRFVVCMRNINDREIVYDKASYLIRAVGNLWINYRVADDSVINIGIAVEPAGAKPGFKMMFEKAEKALLHSIDSKANSYSVYDTEIRDLDTLISEPQEMTHVERIRSILDALPSEAYAMDTNGRIIYMNSYMKHMEPELLDDIRLEVPGEEDDSWISGEDPDSLQNRFAEVWLGNTGRAKKARIYHVSGGKNGVWLVVLQRVDPEKEKIELIRSRKNFDIALSETADLVWEIDLAENSCVRLQEKNVMAVMSEQLTDYLGLRKYFLDHVVHYRDRGEFLYVTDPGYLREAVRKDKRRMRKHIRFIHQDGSWHWYSISTTVSIDSRNEGGIEKIFLMATDINELKKDLDRNNLLESRYRAMLDNSTFMSELARDNERYEHVNELTGIYVFEYDVLKRDYYICTTFENMFTVTPEMKENEWSMLSGLKPVQEDCDSFRKFLKSVKREPDTHEVVVRLLNKFGIARWFRITVQTLNGLNNQLSRVTGILQDVNSEMEVKKELEFRADYDELTRLFNAEAFYRNVSNRLKMYPERNFAIIAMDIEHFRIINDRFGVETGNRCLEYAGKLIQASLHKDGIASRYEADMFSVLVEFDEDNDILKYVTELSESFQFEEAKRCGSTLCFGIYKVDDREIPIRLMCDRARIAKREIKGNKLSNVSVYDDSIRLHQRKVAQMESEMQRALTEHEFVMFLQPKVDLGTGKICSAEALVRWQHPSNGLRMPGEFLPYFESNGFIKKLDEYMWECAAKFVSELSKEGYEIPISVNVSRFHVSHTDLLDKLTGLTKKYGIDNRLIHLEITETLFTEDVNELYRTMGELKELGFVIEMDDFGSGYSSLNMLREAPVDVIKIDRYFVDEIMATKRGRIIIENAITMSKQLGMVVVAEGVETKEQVEFLREANCDIAQGYYYSKPVPADQFKELLK